MTGFHTWVPLEEVTSSTLNGLIQTQVVPQFTSTADRDSQWASPPAGAVCVTTDTGTIWQRGGATWFKPFCELGYAKLGSDMTGIGTGATTLLSQTFTIPVTRRVRAVCDCHMFKGGGESNAIGVLRLNSDTVAGAARNANVNTSTNVPIAVSDSYTLAAGSHTIKAEVYNTASTFSVAATAVLSIFDIGT
jgi:hypothetical protein